MEAGPQSAAESSLDSCCPQRLGRSALHHPHRRNPTLTALCDCNVAKLCASRAPHENSTKRSHHPHPHFHSSLPQRTDTQKDPFQQAGLTQSTTLNASREITLFRTLSTRPHTRQHRVSASTPPFIRSQTMRNPGLHRHQSQAHRLKNRLGGWCGPDMSFKLRVLACGYLIDAVVGGGATIGAWKGRRACPCAP